MWCHKGIYRALTINPGLNFKHIFISPHLQAGGMAGECQSGGLALEEVIGKK